MPAKVVTFVSGKGGVSKTTSSTSIAVEAASKGKKVLLIDLDPQANASFALGIRAGPSDQTIYDLLAPVQSEIDRSRLIKPVRPNLDLIPSVDKLVQLESTLKLSEKLHRKLNPVRSLYDLIIIDTSNYLGMLANNAIYASDLIVIVTQPSPFDADRIPIVQQFIKELDIDRPVKVRTLVSLVNRKTTRINKAFRDDLSNLAEPPVIFKSEIPQLSEAKECVWSGQTITEFKPNSDTALAYKTLLKEILKDLAS